MMEQPNEEIVDINGLNGSGQRNMAEQLYENTIEMTPEDLLECADKILNLQNYAEADKQQKEYIIKTDISYINITKLLEKAGKYEILDSPKIAKALKKCLENIGEYIKPLNETLSEKKKLVEGLQNQVAIIEDKEYDNKVKANNLEMELRQCHFWESERKKELKGKIEQLRKPLEVPENITKSKQEAEKMVDFLSGHIKEYGQWSKRAAWVENEMTMHCPNYIAMKHATIPQNGFKTQKGTNTKPKEKSDFMKRLEAVKPIK